RTIVVVQRGAAPGKELQWPRRGHRDAPDCRLRQSPAPGSAVARGDFRWPRARPAADEKARAVGGQAKTEHQQAASRAQGLPVPSARQDDSPGSAPPATVGNRATAEWW